jgi:NAD+ diphosphatase
MADMPIYQFIARISPPAEVVERAYWFIFQQDKLLVHVVDEGRVSVLQAEELASLGLAPGHPQYLGYLQNGRDQPIHCYAAECHPTAALPADLAAEGLRQVYGRLDDPLFSVAGRAVQIVDWDRNHQYCGRCATPTEAIAGERAKKCPSCGLSSYPRLSPATITAVTRQTEAGKRILLARNHRFPPGRYSVLAGFVEPGESLEECVEREISEEVGIRVQNVRYVGSQPWPFPNSLMIGFTAEYASGEFHLEEAEIDDAQWFAADALPLLPPPMSIARQLIDAFVAEEGTGD